MSAVIDSDDVLALASAFLNADCPSDPKCVADTVEVFNDHLMIHYSYPRGSATYPITQLELMAWGWNNPKV